MGAQLHVGGPVQVLYLSHHRCFLYTPPPPQTTKMSTTTTEIQASVLHGIKDLRVVSQTLHSPQPQTRQTPTHPLPPGTPPTSPTRPRRTSNLHRLHRPMRQRPSLLHPPPQRRHPRPRTAQSRPRILRHRHRGGVLHLPLQIPDRRRRRPRSRPPLHALSPLPTRPLQHLPRNPLP